MLQLKRIKPGYSRAVTIFLAMTVTACVTINIYFPAAAAEKAADKVIDEIWQVPGSAPGETPPSNAQPPAIVTPVQPQEPKP